MNQAIEGTKIIYESMIKGILDYLKTGKFANNTPGSFMSAFNQVHNHADKHSGFLYNYYRKILKEYMELVPKKVRFTSAEDLIDDFLQENHKCNLLIYWMKRVFSHLDKYIVRDKTRMTLALAGMTQFKTIIYNSLKDKVLNAINMLIKEDRDCNVIYRFKIKNTLKIIENLDLLEDIEIIKENDVIKWSGKSKLIELNYWYSNYFESDTQKYISSKADKEIKDLSAPEYIFSSLKYLDEENQRKNEYIHETFHYKLNDLNYEYLIIKNAVTLAKKETGFSHMFKNKKDNEIKDAYTLISKNLACIKVITDEFDPYIRDRGEELYNNKDLMKDPVKFIPALIALKKEMDDLVSFAFNNYIACQDSKNKAFSHFMSKEHYSKQLANYTDYLMKVGFKTFNDQQIEEKLNEVINLFKCLNNKLVFQTEACRCLSGRLILNKSISLNAEKIMIQKLKAEAGVTYVNKMAAMMEDLEIGKKTIDAYRTTSKYKGMPKGIVFQTQVVQQGAWEINKNKFIVIDLPLTLITCIDDFTTFYISKHKEHKLQWCYGLGTLELKYLYLSKAYQSVSTLCQYVLLTKLEQHPELTIEELAGYLGMNVNALLTDATGLIFNPTFNKTKKLENGLILTGLKEREELTKDTKVWINKDFNSSSLKFQTLPLPQKKSAGELQQQEQIEATNQRNYQNMIIDATITRIMKSRIGLKTSHTWLVNEVSKQVELFTAQPPLIKERIESLIEKQIIKRNDKDRTCYDYLA